LGYISVAESLGISSTSFTQCTPNATNFTEITQNKGHYAIQGHSMSPILVPIESSYVGLGRFGFFKFRSIRFGFQYQVLGFVFFSFSLRTPPQCKSILVCENTKTESINFNTKFQLKHIDRPRLVWRSYSSHSVWSTPSHSVWLVCLSICHSS